MPFLFNVSYDWKGKHVAGVYGVQVHGAEPHVHGFPVVGTQTVEPVDRVAEKVSGSSANLVVGVPLRYEAAAGDQRDIGIGQVV